MIELLAVELPKTLHFLQPGWIVLHLAAIPLVFVLGMAFARRRMPAVGSGSIGTSPGPGY